MPKQTHSEQLLDSTFKRYCDDLALNGHKLSKDLGEEFEQFTAECVLKRSGVSLTEVKAGILGGERDGGIDAAYLFVDGRLLSDEDDVTQYVKDELTDAGQKHKRRKPNSVEVVLLQAKRGKASGSDVPMKIEKTLKNFFGDEAYESNVNYSDELVQKIEFIKTSVLKLEVSSQNITFQVHPCTARVGRSEGHAGEVSADIRRPIQQEYSRVNVEYEVYGPDELLERWEFTDDCSAVLECDHTYALGSHQVMIVKTAEFYRFITDGDGAIRDPLFDGNVRAYLGSRK